MLKDELKEFTGNKRKFLLLRIAGMSRKVSWELCGIQKGTYNTWLQKDSFINTHQRIEELAQEYKQEAIQLLRRDNQLSAILLEKSIIEKLRTEIADENYVLVKTHLAREVYSRLLNDLDSQPEEKKATWEDFIQGFIEAKPSPECLPEAPILLGEGS